MAKAKELDKLGEWYVGQKVIEETHLSKRLTTITRITDGRGGTLYTEYKSLGATVNINAYDKDGWMRGGGAWSKSRIQPATPEAVKELKVQITRRKIEQISWRKIPDDTILEIKDFLNEKGLDI